MGIFRRDKETRSEIEEEKVELEVESALMHVRLLANELLGALDNLEHSITKDVSESNGKAAPTEPKEKPQNEPPF